MGIEAVASVMGPFLVSLFANLATESGSVAAGRISRTLNSQSYSEHMDRLSEDFTTSLRESLELDDERIDWQEFPNHLDESEAVFENEENGINAIVEAIEAAHERDFDENPGLRDRIKLEVTDAYEQSLKEFSKRVAGTELAEVLEAEAHIDLTSTTNEICEELTKIQERIRRQEKAALQNIGFNRIDEDFNWNEPKDYEPEDIITAWRTGFTLSEVKAGYSLRRERTTTDRRYFSTELIEKLQNGENSVITGPSGSGKSTVCKTVACEWCENPNTGPVFYRKSPTGTSFTEPGTLNQAIQAEEDRVLVVVEDATDEDSHAIFDTIGNFTRNEGVSFLLESRNSDRDNDLNQPERAKMLHERDRLSTEEVPQFDEPECQRAIELFEKHTEREINKTGKELFREIKQIEPIDIGGEALFLAYRLIGPQIEVADNTRRSPLHDHVTRVYSDVHKEADEINLKQEVATMVNVLNTADLPIKYDYIYSLASNKEDKEGIKEALRFLDGRMFKRDRNTGEIRTPHQLWSTLYLETLLDNSDFENYPAYKIFENCVEGLFRLFDDEYKQERVERLSPKRGEIIQQIQEDSEKQSRRVVQKIASIGQSRPSLGQLLRTPERWQVDLPANCSTNDRIYWYYSRGLTQLDRNSLKKARLEFGECEKILESLSKDEDVYTEGWYKQWQSKVKSNLGTIYRREGDLEKAENYLKQTLILNVELGKRQNVAGTLVNLGTVARKRREYEIAKKYLEDSIRTNRYIVNVDSHLSQPTKSIINSRTKLGEKLLDKDIPDSTGIRFGQIVSEPNAKPQTVAVTIGRAIPHENGETENTQYIILDERLEENQDRSLVCFGKNQNEEETDSTKTGGWNRTLTTSRSAPWPPSVRFGKAADDANVINLNTYGMSLNGLGHIAMKCNELEEAKQYFEESRRIKREVGNRYGQSLALNSLGKIARQEGELGQAKKYFEKSLRISKEIGNRLGQAISYDHLGHIAREQGELKVAEEFYEESRQLSEVDGNEPGQAISLDGLGQVFRQRGNLAEAEAKHQRSMEINEKFGNRHGRAVSLDGLGRIARERGDYMRAEERHQESLEIDQEEGHKQGQAISQLDLGKVALSRGNIEDAADRFRKSLALFKELNDHGWKIRSLVGLTIVASELEDWDRLEDYTDGLVELYKGVVAMEDMFTALEKGIDRISSEGDYSRAIRLCDDGIKLASQADDENAQEEFQFKKSKFMKKNSSGKEGVT